MGCSSKTKGVSIIGAIAIILLVSVFTTALLSMFGTSTRTSLDSMRSVHALGLAQAGLNWAMENLTESQIWDSSTLDNISDVALGPGSFDVNYTIVNASDTPFQASSTANSTTATAVNVTVVGKIPGNDGVIIKHTMSQRVFKLPSASKFALFWGRNPGATLTVSNVAINGSYWSIGSTTFSSSTVQNGTAYKPTTTTFTGAPANQQNITYPYFSNISTFSSTFSTPPINATFYTDRMNAFNSTIDTCGNRTADITLTGNLVLSGTLCCRDFRASINNNNRLTISGRGFIVANRFVSLANVSKSGTQILNITPTTGDIVILANQSLTINRPTGAGTNIVNITGTPVNKVYLYARSATSNAQSIFVDEESITNITNAVFLAATRITVQDNATIYNSTMFVNSNSTSATNNALTVTGVGTVIGNSTSPCNIISLGRANPSLSIATSSNMSGFIYQWDSGNTGTTSIAGTSSAARVIITGTLIANQFTGNLISNAVITYNASVIPDPPPERFDGFATKDPDSWSGL